MPLIAVAALLSRLPVSVQEHTSSRPAAQPIKPQPIPFSHKLHARFITDCLYCHETTSRGWNMSYPAGEKCMQCHSSIKSDSPAIKKLAATYGQKKPIPWVRVYEVPDYVFFSHQTHIKKAIIGCAACHGPVAERDVITQEKPTSMAFCMDCHKQRGAAATCRTCHER